MNTNALNIKDLFSKIEVSLRNPKSKESLDLLKLLYKITVNYKTRDLTSLKLKTVNIEKLSKLIIDINTPFKIKLLLISIISKISNVEPQILTIKNLKTYEPKQLAILLSLLLSTCTHTPLFLESTPLIIQSLVTQDQILRSVSFPSALIHVRQYTDSLTNSQIKPIETQLVQFLLHASLVSDQKQSTGFFKIGNTTTAVPVTELDGSVTIEFFTVLNNSMVYTEDQIFNIYSFSMLYTWLTNLYKPGLIASDTSEEGTQRVMNSTFLNTIVSYCLRIIDQSKLKPNPYDGGSGRNDVYDNLPVTALLESVRILDYLCRLDSNLIAKIFPTVQKAYQLHLPSSRTTNENSGYVLLALLQFFLNHSHTLVYDPEPLFKAYFQTYLPRTFTNSFVAFETLNFCLKNQEVILKNTNVFNLYFPPIFKCLAWFPHSFYMEFQELFPSFISPNTFIEVFHLLLDLPLLTLSMESSLIEQKRYSNVVNAQNASNQSSFSSYPQLFEPSASEFAVEATWSEFRVLYNYLLRNESGVNINFWSSTTLPLLYQLCKKSPITPRCYGSCELVSPLLDIYFDVLLEYGDRSIFVQLLPVLLERFDQIFPFEIYQKKIKENLIEKVLTIFKAYPNLIISEKDLIISVISEGRLMIKDSLTLTLCWIIGEYTSTFVGTQVTAEVFSDYYEALELLTYERINSIKMDAVSGSSSSSLTTANNIQSSNVNIFTSSLSIVDTPQNQYNITLMLILIGSLTKLSSRWPDATSRVILCLLKVISYHQYFDSQVIQRANECISLLKFPSFAAAIYNGEPHYNSSFYIESISKDSQTSLSFLFPSSSNIDNNNSNSQLQNQNANSSNSGSIHPYILK
ncbi:hypothetical protein DLAC_02792 [Tieghemostelium lacteum]|uniref:AP-5 complex subunit beta-1 n=1 Tax=Tieghemostelium lacteum TaxID=361077 RepID=A0A152A3G2_TIELA|nr:hypothetical protein DLAC_02792 [Tieghemostelium lacteum]|eukprot:KYR00749.1 hypothetical protein DLAC_02792 [Tieghemostelium lacteum]